MMNIIKMSPKSTIPLFRITSQLPLLTSKQYTNPTPFIPPSSNFNTSTQPTRYVFEDINNLDQAVTLFNQMLQTQPPPPVWDYCKLLNILVKIKHYSHVITFFNKLLLLGCPINDYTMNIVLKCYCHLKQLNSGFAIVATFLKRGYAPDIVTYNTLIHGLCDSKSWDEAYRLLRQMGQMGGCGAAPNIRTFTTLVNAYRKEGLMENAEEVLETMAGVGIRPDVVTYTALMKGYCLRGQLGKAKEVLNLVEENGMEPDLISYSTLIDGYCKNVDIDGAWKIFKKMPRKGLKLDTTAYSCMMQGLFRVGRWRQALKLYHEMKVVGLRYHNVYTFGIVLDGLLNNGKFHDAKLLYHEVDGKGLAGHVSFYTTFINYLCITGQLGFARSIFDKLPSKGLYPDVITYNVMINGLCQKGRFQDAKHLLDKMEKSGCFPDRVTYNNIIRRCVKDCDSFDNLNIMRVIAEKDFALDASTFSILFRQMQASDEDLGKKSLLQKLLSNDTKYLI